MLVTLIVYSFCIYLILSISISNIYNVTKVFDINIAFIIVMGAYGTFLIRNNYVPLVSAVILSLTATIGFGMLIEKYVYKQMRIINLYPFSYLVVSIGLFIIFQNLISLYFGDDTKTLNTGEITVGHQIFGAYITTVQIITIIVAFVVFVGMYLLYNYTSLGKQIRAVSENSELAGIYGISSNKIILIVTAISSGLAAIAGILYAYDTNLTPTMGFNLLLYGIVAMIIGGVGSFRGLLFGSLLLATAQNLVAYYLDTKWMDAATYIILIAFLLWKPLGFSGKRLKKVEI